MIEKMIDHVLDVFGILMFIGVHVLVLLELSVIIYVFSIMDTETIVALAVFIYVTHVTCVIYIMHRLKKDRKEEKKRLALEDRYDE